MDFTNLNKACPKDPYLFPHVDQLINRASDLRLLSFMDAYSGYNQIRMDPLGAHRMAFMKNMNNYYYEIGRSMEVYVDNMVIQETLEEPSTKVEEVMTLNNTRGCMIPIVQYLSHNELTEEEAEAANEIILS